MCEFYSLFVLSAEYLCHVYVRSDSLSGVVIADNEYPSRVCFTLLDKVGSCCNVVSSLKYLGFHASFLAEMKHLEGCTMA